MNGLLEALVSIPGIPPEIKTIASVLLAINQFQAALLLASPLKLLIAAIALLSALDALSKSMFTNKKYFYNIFSV